jgi:hygromycin-B 4-O-kinase
MTLPSNCFDSSCESPTCRESISRSRYDWGNAVYGDFLYDLANFTFWAPWHPSMRGTDWTAEALRYYKNRGLVVPDFEKRLRACELHIGLMGMAWNSNKSDWEELEATTNRALELAALPC